jgi:hypothetical protein
VRHERTDQIVLRFALVTLMLPAVVTTAGLVIQRAALAHARARIPVNWGGAGAPPGSVPVWLPPALAVVGGFGLPAVFGLSSLPSLRRGDRSPSFRIFGAQALGISVLQTTVATFLVLQRIGATASHQSRAWVPLFAGLAAGVIAAVVGWFLQPKGSRPALARAVIPLELAPSERAAWMRTAFLPLPAVAVIIAVAAFVGLKADFGWLAGDRHDVAAILTIVAMLLIALLATTAAFHVHVNARGLSVRSALGIPRFRVALHEVDSVAVLDPRSLGIAGSWGIRVHPDRTTIVTRSRTGIQVTRHDGRTLFVTVDDAATGAALLEALAARAKAASAKP